MHQSNDIKFNDVIQLYDGLWYTATLAIEMYDKYQKFGLLLINLSSLAFWASSILSIYRGVLLADK